MSFVLGSPIGWWEDVFQMELALDSEKLTNRGGLLGPAKCPLYSSDDRITGKLKITPPPNTSVWQYGIIVELQGSVSFFEDFNTVDLIKVETQVVEEGYISEETEYSFEIDLAVIENMPVMDTYDGDLFSIGYELIATAKRPWYTFDVFKHSMLTIQNVNTAPLDDVPDRVAKHLLESSSDAPISHELKIRDYSGFCSINLDRLYYNIGDTIKARLTFKNNPEIPISDVRLVFYKIEKGDGDENEAVIKEQIIDLSKATSVDVGAADVLETEKQVVHPTGTASADASSDKLEDTHNSETVLAAAEPVGNEGETARVEVDDQGVEMSARTQPDTDDGAVAKASSEVMKSVDCEFRLGADKASVGASLEENITHKDVFVSVRYFLRVLVEDNQGHKHWNTNEVILYRKELEGTAVV